jgi:eukaryotic-like serine/threonine-protein kinase
MPHVTPLHADDPSHVGRYRLSGRIAGMPSAGPAYLGRTVDGGDVTITLLGGDWTGDPAERDRFTAEANAASRVAPFCAARILGAGFEGKQAFLVSEHVAGPSLFELVTGEGRWEGGDLEALAIGAATGLAAVHQAGLVHGDFGPEYVVLGPNGPRVIEFGITPPYGSATPAADMRGWAQTVLFAATGGPTDPSAENLELLPEPLRTLARRCLSGGAGEQPSARSVVVELLGDSNPPAGVLGEGSRRAAGAAAPPALPPAPADSREAPRGTRTRRVAAIWWAAGVAVCILAIAVAIRIAQSQSNQPSRPSDTAKPTPHASLPTRPARAATIPASAAGTWSGQVSQNSPSGAFSVSVQVTLAAGASGGTVLYSGPFSCVDNLGLVSDTAGTLRMDQAVVRGPCQPGVVTLIPVSKTTMHFSFKGKGAPAATGTLARAAST